MTRLKPNWSAVASSYKGLYLKPFEIALAVDMCFAAVGKAIFGHPEVAVGLVPWQRGFWWTMSPI